MLLPWLYLRVPVTTGLLDRSLFAWMGDVMAETEHCAAKEGSGDDLNAELTSLRDEIRKSEEARLDFLKYKLIAVATLAAVAFGLGSGNSTSPVLDPRYTLAVIPFVCVYVDALCYHNNLRIFVIAKYMRCHGDSYEQFLDKWQQVLSGKRSGVRYFFEMEDWVLDSSTQSLAFLVAVGGLFSGDVMQQITIYLSGLVGLILSWVMRSQYDTRTDSICSDGCDVIIAKTFAGR